MGWEREMGKGRRIRGERERSKKREVEIERRQIGGIVNWIFK